MNVDPTPKWWPDADDRPVLSEPDPCVWRPAAIFLLGTVCALGSAVGAGAASAAALTNAGVWNGSLAFILIVGASAFTAGIVGLLAIAPIWMFGEAVCRRIGNRRARTADQRRLRSLIEGRPTRTRRP